jgi:drug/metabolite transporter (DMT)-like permease
MAGVGVAAALRHKRSPLLQRATLPGVGVGLLVGASGLLYYLALDRLPVSVAAPLGNTDALVAFALTVLLRHEPITQRSGVGAALTLTGAALLASQHL